MYQYHQEGVFVPSLIPFKRLIAQKRYSGRKELIKYKLSWLRTLVFFNRDFSDNHLLNLAKKEGFDLKYKVTKSLLTIMKQEVDSIDQNGNAKKLIIHTKRHFIWDEKALLERFKTKDKIKQYKKMIIAQHMNQMRSKKKEELVMEQIQNNSTITLNELVRRLDGRVGRKFISNLIKQKKLAVSRQSKLYSLIGKKLNELFKYKVDYVNEVMTYQLLAEWIGVKRLTLQRYLNDHPDQKSKIKTFNKTLRTKKKDKSRTSKISSKSFEF